MTLRFTSYILASLISVSMSAAFNCAQAQASPTTPAPAPAGLTLKRTPLPSSLLPACPVSRQTTFEPTDAQRRQARDLAARAQQDAILGDSASALSHLRDARKLDPNDADLAYQLARAYENANSPDSAAVEYCRFTALAPRSADAADARDRIAVLVKPTVDPVIEAVNTLFQQGLTAFDAGHMPEADARFTRAVETQPAWADAYFNRAVTRLAENDREGAAGDFEVYLRLKPNADDRQVVSAQLPGLRRAKFSANQALVLGIFIPGAGQFYTNRPAWGTAVLALAGAGIGAAFVPSSKTETVQQTGTDPFGNPYQFSSTRRVTNHPYFIPGLAAAGALAIIGASEAYVFANSANTAPTKRVSLLVVPATQTTVGMRIAF